MTLWTVIVQWQLSKNRVKDVHVIQPKPPKEAPLAGRANEQEDHEFATSKTPDIVHVNGIFKNFSSSPQYTSKYVAIIYQMECLHQKRVKDYAPKSKTTSDRPKQGYYTTVYCKIKPQDFFGSSTSERLLKK